MHIFIDIDHINIFLIINVHIKEYIRYIYGLKINNNKNTHFPSPSLKKYNTAIPYLQKTPCTPFHLWHTTPSQWIL